MNHSHYAYSFLDVENTIRNLSVGLQTMSFPQRVVSFGKILKEETRYYTI